MVTNRVCFGPVPSRRLGRSLGINNIAPKACSYSCIYCQVGPTKTTEIDPRTFFLPDKIYDEVVKHLRRVQETGEPINYITFVPDGEPALDSRLGDAIDSLRPLGIPIAIISNASLIWRKEVRETMMKVDWVSLKVDAIQERLWRRLNRPYGSLDHKAVLEGVMVFSRHFHGTLVTESMLIRDLNDSDTAAGELAHFLGELGPDKAYLSIPTRPPAEKRTQAPEEAALNRVYQIIHRQVKHLELLTGYEGDCFASAGNVLEDLLAITSVHPMREDAVRKLIIKRGANWHSVEQLVKNEQLMATEYKGHRFYLRRTSK